MENILVSIVTPCFNSAKTIERTILSVLNQSYSNVEYIIIDGASTDDTMAVVERYSAQFGARLTVVSEKDNGIYDAMNKGIAMAKGQLVGIINSDDWYETDTIEKMIAQYAGQKYCVLYGMQRLWQDDKIHSIAYYSHEFLETQMVAHPTCFITNATYQDFGAYALRYRSSADYDYLLSLKQSGLVAFVPLFEVLANFTMGGMSSGQIGVRETAHIRLERNLISKKAYLWKCLKSRAYQFLTSK